MNGRTALVLGRSAYKLQFLVRTRLGWQRDFIPPIQLGDLRSRNPSLFEPGLVAQWDEKVHVLTAQIMYLLQRGEVEVVVAVYLSSRGYGGAVLWENALVMGVDHELEIW